MPQHPGAILAIIELLWICTTENDYAGGGKVARMAPALAMTLTADATSVNIGICSEVARN